ncbi:MAG: HEAT repeat domain-containing protein [Akkermansiaceae bacterium]
MKHLRESSSEFLALMLCKTSVPSLLLPILFAVCLPGWGQVSEEEARTIKIVHPDGKDADSFVRSRHVAVGSLGDIEEKDGVMLFDLHHPQYNFEYGGAFVELFKVMKPADDQVLASIKKHSDVLLIKSKAKPDHWEVAGVEAPYPKELQGGRPANWLSSSFLENRMREEMFYLAKYRYKGFVDDNLKKLKDRDPDTRSRSMGLLSVIKPDDADVTRVIDVIGELIKSEDESDRRAAAQAIGSIGGKDAKRYVSDIAEMLYGNTDKRAQELREAILSVCRIGGPEAQKHIPRIIELMEYPGLTHQCLYSLGEMGDQAVSAVPAILGQLTRVDKEGRRNIGVAMTSLRKIAPNDPKVIEALRRSK